MQLPFLDPASQERKIAQLKLHYSFVDWPAFSKWRIPKAFFIQDWREKQCCDFLVLCAAQES